ncbi:MAG: preprotein translocase subunit SecG [Anaerotignum sp.]|nr:preprotein translocase subunit SecG [Anaerotignum sp.]
MMIQEVFHMSTIGTVLTVALIALTVVLATIILMQSKRSAGLGAVSGNSSADSFWSKNKSNSVEGKLERYTKILGAAFMIIAFIVNLVG